MAQDKMKFSEKIRSKLNTLFSDILQMIALKVQNMYLTNIKFNIMVVFIVHFIVPTIIPIRLQM
jgi:hypothetical protein